MYGAPSTRLLTVLPILVAASLGSAGCVWEVNSPSEPSGEARQGIEVPRPSAPSWVPPLTDAQTSLIAPLSRPIETPARRVFPDLARFGYATNRPLASDEDAIKFTRMVTKVLDDSPRYYVLDELPPGAANTVLQYGPPASPPDGYQVVRRDAQGFGLLVTPAGVEEARAAVAEGAALEQQGKREAALALYREAIARSPEVPALRVALAAAVAKAGQADQAEALYREAVTVDPTFAPAHLALAELAEQRGDRASARAHLVEALAYHPPSPRGLALLRRLEGRPSAIDGGWADPPKDAASPVAPVAHVDPFPIFLDVDRAGAVRMAAAKTEAAQIYGGCRALMRFEPAVRAQIFQQPRETPHSLSVAEEVVCLEAGLGAYVATSRDKSSKTDKRDKRDERDPTLDQLLRMAHEDGLSGYVMYEILGQHRPERARMAPADVHRDIARYLDRWVLSRHDPIPEAGTTAAR